jgi:nucleotide-binding universal stress UspA family protein
VSRCGPDRRIVVVVGEDGSGHAVEWAAAEAAARRSALDVVHAARVRWTIDPYGCVPVADVAASRAAAQEVLHEAVDRARSVAPDVVISARSLPDRSVRSLVRQSRGAELLVLSGAVAGRSRRGLRLPGSWSRRVAARAGCPVAVVKPLRSGPYAGPPPRVVVGVDGTPASAAALTFALRAAEQRGLSLTVVHAFAPGPPAGTDSAFRRGAGSEARARLVLDEALADRPDRFVDVPVELRTACGDPAMVLARESTGAALVVVGCPGRVGLFGSISDDLVQQARCTAVVVGPGEAVRDRHARLGERAVSPAANDA